jgi:uncharacterized protein (TIGR03435 family)
MQSTTLAFLSAGLITFATVLVPGLRAQAPATGEPASAELRFEAVSIKLRTDKPTSFSTRNLPNGGVLMVAGSVTSLITSAYGTTVESKTLPAWATSTYYDVTATSPLTGNATPTQRQSMVRAMLTERFNFEGHVESHEQPAFDLVVAHKDGRLGPSMKPSPVDCAAQAAAQRPALEAALASGTLPPSPPMDPAAPPPDCRGRSTRGVIEGDLTIPSMLMFIRGMAGRPVIDKTGLTGYYRVRLEVALRQPGADSTAIGIIDPPDVFTALPAQLGLKLEESKTMVSTVIVDRIERPTEN